jgi:hypothetical protein
LAADVGDLCICTRRRAGDCGLDHGRNPDRHCDRQLDLAEPLGGFGGVVRFSDYLPARASEFMHEIVEPQGVVAVLITLVVVAIAAGVVLGAVRLHRFTLIRDGDVLHHGRGLLSKETATIPVGRVQAVRIVEGFGACSSATAACRSRSPESDG